MKLEEVVPRYVSFSLDPVYDRYLNLTFVNLINYLKHPRMFSCSLISLCIYLSVYDLLSYNFLKSMGSQLTAIKAFSVNSLGSSIIDKSILNQSTTNEFQKGGHSQF